MLDAAQVLLPGIFVVLVTWLGARFAVDGEISAGELVAFYGYAAFLIMPLRTATEFADKLIRAHIGARRCVRVLRSSPTTRPTAPTTAAAPPAGRRARPTRVSGVAVAPGGSPRSCPAGPEEPPRWPTGSAGPAPVRTRVTLGGVPLADLPLAEVRRRVVVSETDPRLFSGPLRDAARPGRRRSDDERVLAAARGRQRAHDVLDALPDGLDSEVEERGRSFSGGQRQRLVLARALLADPEVLVLVEPTSAVDAHTEARIAGGLAAAAPGGPRS